MWYLKGPELYGKLRRRWGDAWAINPPPQKKTFFVTFNLHLRYWKLFQTLFHWLVIIPIPHPLSICFRRFYFDNELKKLSWVTNENDFLLSGQSGWKCWPHGVWPLICNGIPKLSFQSRISWHGVARVHVHPNVKENQKIHLDFTNIFVNCFKIVKTWEHSGDFARAPLKHVWDHLWTLNSPQTPRLTLMHPKGNSRLRLYQNHDLPPGINIY